MGFYVWDTIGDDDDDLCILRDFVDGIGMDSWRVQAGEPLASIFPKSARIFMSKESPGIKLASFVGNTQRMLIVARPLKETIEKHCSNPVEYLPITIYDHRKRAYGKDYFLINPVGAHDCLNFKASDIVWDDEDPDEIIRINKRVLSKSKVKNAPQLCRLGRDTSRYLVGEELAQAIKKGRFTNVGLIEVPVK